MGRLELELCFINSKMNFPPTFWHKIKLGYVLQLTIRNPDFTDWQLSLFLSEDRDRSYNRWLLSFDEIQHSFSCFLSFFLPTCVSAWSMTFEKQGSGLLVSFCWVVRDEGCLARACQGLRLEGKELWALWRETPPHASQGSPMPGWLQHGCQLRPPDTEAASTPRQRYHRGCEGQWAYGVLFLREGYST